MAPFVKGLDGSTETMPTFLSSSRYMRMRLAMMLLFPTPGGPVKPTVMASPVDGYSSEISAGRSCSSRSILEMTRANALLSPDSRPSTSPAAQSGTETRAPCDLSSNV